MARRSNAANHTHRYRRENLGRDGKEYWIYRCIKPGCSHYISEAVIRGRLCECNRCHKDMIMGNFQMYGSHGGPMTLPHCVECTKSKKKPDISAAEAMEKFLSGMK